MGIEIERKFLVTGDSWRDLVSKTISYEQGYLSTDKERAVRVRRSDDKAWLTIKGKKQGLAAPEYEYEIPTTDCLEILRGICIQPSIKKTRHHVVFQSVLWEIDVFHGENEGLVLAEVELCYEDEEIAYPSWVGEEVTSDPRYSNASLAENPFSKWGLTKTGSLSKKDILISRLRSWFCEYF